MEIKGINNGTRRAAVLLSLFISFISARDNEGRRQKNFQVLGDQQK